MNDLRHSIQAITLPAYGCDFADGLRRARLDNPDSGLIRLSAAEQVMMQLRETIK